MCWKLGAQFGARIDYNSFHKSATQILTIHENQIETQTVEFFLTPSYILIRDENMANTPSYANSHISESSLGSYRNLTITGKF